MAEDERRADRAERRRTSEELHADGDQLRQRLAECTAELKVASAEFQAIYEGMVDGLLIADVETARFVRANPAMCRMTGYSEEELVARTVYDLHPPEHLPDVLEDFRAQANQRQILAEDVPVLRKDGSVFPADVTAAPVVYHGRRCVIGFFRDITERQRVQEELRASEARYRELIENANSIILRMDVEGNVTFFNRFAESCFGFPREEIIGRNVVGTIVPPVESSGRDLAAHIRHVCQHPEQHLNDENENITRDGTRLWVSWTNRPIRDVGSQQDEILCVGNDITKRKQAEEALHEEQRVLRQLLESHERERKLVAYEIHDVLAQQLAAATMQLQAFQRLRENDPEAAARALDAGLDLLGRSVVETRRLISGLRPPVLDESGVVMAIKHLVNETGGPERLAIELALRVRFRRLQPLLENAIFRIVQESLTNARRHSRSDRVRIALIQEGSEVHIEVRDWGVGFDPEAVGSSGFGLRGIHERARVLGGKATIHSAPGQGTRLTAVLPLAVR